MNELASKLWSYASFFPVCSNTYVLVPHNHVSEGEENSITWSSLDSAAKDFFLDNDKTEFWEDH